MRVAGLDLGTRRIGVAISDRFGKVASPRFTLVRGDDPELDRRRLLDFLEESSVEVVVVGLPINLDGSTGRAAKEALAQARELAKELEPRGVRVETFDERLTTVSAERNLARAGVRSSARRHVVDQEAAAVLLQAWLDAHTEGATDD